MNSIVDAIRKNWADDQDRIDSLIASVYMFGIFDAHTGVKDELIDSNIN
jgi:hypothetical protein